MLCHSVRSFFSPVVRSFQLSLVAMLKFAILPPFWNVLISGSLPRLPSKITLLTDPAIILHPCRTGRRQQAAVRSEEHTSELQSLMRISYAVFCLKKKNQKNIITTKKHVSNKRGH